MKMFLSVLMPALFVMVLLQSSSSMEPGMKSVMEVKMRFSDILTDDLAKQFPTKSSLKTGNGRG